MADIFADDIFQFFPREIVVTDVVIYIQVSLDLLSLQSI